MGLRPQIGRNDSTKRLRFVGLGGSCPRRGRRAAAPPGGGGAVRTDREAGEGGRRPPGLGEGRTSRTVEGGRRELAGVRGFRLHCEAGRQMGCRSERSQRAKHCNVHEPGPLRTVLKGLKAWGAQGSTDRRPPPADWPDSEAELARRHVMRDASSMLLQTLYATWLTWHTVCTSTCVPTARPTRAGRNEAGAEQLSAARPRACPAPAARYSPRGLGAPTPPVPCPSRRWARVAPRARAPNPRPRPTPACIARRTAPRCAALSATAPGTAGRPARRSNGSCTSGLARRPWRPTCGGPR